MRPVEFNKKVWAALKLIPRGRVTTYKELAKYLGKPKAARAVGNACGANPDAPRVPCHRVVRSDGRLDGRFKVLLHHFVNIWQPPHSELDNSMIFLDDYSVSLVSRKSPHLTL